MQLIAGEDYYLENGFLVMTATYHTKRGQCCGSGCRHCPFTPKHREGAIKLASDFEDQATGGESKREMRREL